MLKTSDKNRILKLLAPSKKLGSVQVAYIHGDGHLVVKYERWINAESRHLAVVKVARFSGVELAFRGRIVVRSYGGVQAFRAALLAGLQVIHASIPNIEHGSENTKKSGIAVGHVTFGTKLAGELGHAQFNYLTGPLITGPFNYDYDQAEVTDRWEDYGDEWCGYPIVEKIDLASAPALAVAA